MKTINKLEELAQSRNNISSRNLKSSRHNSFWIRWTSKETRLTPFSMEPDATTSFVHRQSHQHIGDYDLHESEFASHLSANTTKEKAIPKIEQKYYKKKRSTTNSKSTSTMINKQNASRNKFQRILLRICCCCCCSESLDQNTTTKISSSTDNDPTYEVLNSKDNHHGSPQALLIPNDKDTDTNHSASDKLLKIPDDNDGDANENMSHELLEVPDKNNEDVNYNISSELLEKPNDNDENMNHTVSNELLEVPDEKNEYANHSESNQLLEVPDNHNDNANHSALSDLLEVPDEKNENADHSESSELLEKPDDNDEDPNHGVLNNSLEVIDENDEDADHIVSSELLEAPDKNNENADHSDSSELLEKPNDNDENMNHTVSNELLEVPDEKNEYANHSESNQLLEVPDNHNDNANHSALSDLLELPGENTEDVNCNMANKLLEKPDDNDEDPNHTVSNDLLELPRENDEDPNHGALNKSLELIDEDADQSVSSELLEVPDENNDSANHSVLSDVLELPSDNDEDVNYSASNELLEVLNDNDEDTTRNVSNNLLDVSNDKDTDENHSASNELLKLLNDNSRDVIKTMSNELLEVSDENNANANHSASNGLSELFHDNDTFGNHNVFNELLEMSNDNGAYTDDEISMSLLETDEQMQDMSEPCSFRNNGNLFIMENQHQESASEHVRESEIEADITIHEMNETEESDAESSVYGEVDRLNNDTYIEVMQEHAKLKAYYDMFPDIDDNTEKMKSDLMKAEQFTKSILGNLPSGDVHDRNTACHVLNNLFKNSEENCLFYESKGGINLYDAFQNITDSDSQDLPIVLELSSSQGLGNIQHVQAREDELKLIQQLNEAVEQKQSNAVLDNIIERLANVHGVNIKDIVIQNLFFGILNIVYTIKNRSKNRKITLETLAEYRNQFQHFVNAKIHPLLRRLSFDISCFDPRGNKTFPKMLQMFEIGPPGRTQLYIQPAGWTRYGLKVLERYEDDSWLDPFQDPNNWYRAFHGTKKAKEKYFDEKDESTDWIYAPVHAMFSIYHNGFRKSRNHEYGNGVYCSPDPIYTEENYVGSVPVETQQGEKYYKCMLQVAVYPDGVTFHNNNQTWVVANSKNIRPYGILIKEDK